MSRLWNAIAGVVRWFSPRNENLRQDQDFADAFDKYRTDEDGYCRRGLSNLSPIEEARLRNCAFWELRQW